MSEKNKRDISDFLKEIQTFTPQKLIMTAIQEILNPDS